MSKKINKLAKEFVVNLDEPVQYVPKGGSELIKSQALTIFCPTQRQRASIDVIDTIYSKYMTNAQKSFFNMFGLEKLSPFKMAQKIEEFKEVSREHFNKDKEKEKERFVLSDMKAHIEGKDLTDCYGALQNILCGSAKLDIETCVNVESYKKLSLIDTEKLLEEFIRNFIIRSPQS